MGSGASQNASSQKYLPADSTASKSQASTAVPARSPSSQVSLNSLVDRFLASAAEEVAPRILAKSAGPRRHKLAASYRVADTAVDGSQNSNSEEPLSNGPGGFSSKLKDQPAAPNANANENAPANAPTVAASAIVNKSTIQSIALTHKLRRLGSYTQAVSFDHDVGPPEKSTYKISFDEPNTRMLLLDPLSSMKRASSSPMMQLSDGQAPSMLRASISPVPLTQIHETDNESCPPTPIKDEAASPFPVALTLQVEVGDDFRRRQGGHAASGRPDTFKKQQSFEDDDDWDIVSDDDNENSMAISTSPRLMKPRLSVHSSCMTEESYRITQSGTIWIDDLNEPIPSEGSTAPSTTMRDRLVFLQKLGQGASGTVYKAIDLLTLEIVAVKIVNIYDRDKRRQLVHELVALHASSLNSARSNQNVLKFMDSFGNATDATVGLIVEYMDGGSLQDIVDSGGCDNEMILSSMAKQLLLGLAFLQDECSQIHRDLKPANVLINNKGEVKISDFGVAKDMLDDSGTANSSKPNSVPTSNTFVGTLTYMSPERINGEEYSYKSDVWSLGLTILTTALGKLPIETEGGYWSVMACVREDEPPTLDNDPKWTEEFRDFISKCLTKDQAQRPSCKNLLSHSWITAAQDSYDSTNLYDNRETGNNVSAKDLDYILEAIFVHAEQMVKRKAVFRRDASDGAQVLPAMLSEMILKNLDMLKNLAGQLDLDLSYVVEKCTDFVARSAYLSYLNDDSDSD